uniref:Reverse transcriptase domain-containing protein n=1 Tax=Tanacetum cinerariifolium TaxID=118510 RepID=A0A6L2KVL4_TANCI|nr:reverse transcriptase domain-containing protein [Tanacetum cinerariifolium]
MQQKVTQSFAHVKEIMFSPLVAHKGIGGPLVIEEEINGHAVHRIYIGGGSSMEVLYKHCFKRIRAEIKSQMVPTTTSLTSFSGETIWPLGQLRLLDIPMSDRKTRAGPGARQGNPSRGTKTSKGRNSARSILPRLVIQPSHGEEARRAAEEMFLGYMINPEGKKSCPDKTEAVLQLPSPRTIKEVHSLNGKLASLNRFISKSVEKSLPLFKTVKKCIKKSDFHWTPDAEQAFKQVKQHLARLPMLVAPKPKEELIMYLSASYGVISAVLMTERDIILPDASYRDHHRPDYQAGQILADFLIEKPDDASPKASVIETPQEPWTLFTDGSSCVDGSGTGLGIDIASPFLEGPRKVKFIDSRYGLFHKVDRSESHGNNHRRLGEEVHVGQHSMPFRSPKRNSLGQRETFAFQWTRREQTRAWVKESRLASVTDIIKGTKSKQNRTKPDESSLAGGGKEKGLLAVDYMTGRAAAQKSFRSAHYTAESLGAAIGNQPITQKCLHAWLKVYRLDSVVHKRKRSSVQTQAGKRRITNQRVPGFVSQKRKHSSIQRQCGERLITYQCVTSHPTVTDDVGSINAQIKGLAAFHPEPNIFLQSSRLTESSSRIRDPFDQRRVFANIKRFKWILQIWERIHGGCDRAYGRAWSQSLGKSFKKSPVFDQVVCLLGSQSRPSILLEQSGVLFFLGVEVVGLGKGYYPLDFEGFARENEGKKWLCSLSSRLIMSQNRATLKTIILIRMIHRVFHNNILVVLVVGVLMRLVNFSVIHQPPQEMSIQEMEDLKHEYLDEMKRLINLEYCDEIKIDEYGDEHLDTILATESDEFIKSSVENLIPIPSESEGILDNMCDVPFHENSLPLGVSKDQFEDFSDSNNEFSSTDNDSFSIDNIEYVEASPSDSKLASSEVMEIVILKVGGFDDDILLTIKDDILREKLLNINLLIAKIEALNDNPTPSSDFMTKSSSTSLNSLLEETNTFDNSLPEFETLCFDAEEISSGSTTTRSDISLPEYEAFYDDHVKEISSGSTTTHFDSSLYDSFIFDLSINLFPPAGMSDFYKFADELIHIISPPEYDCFLFKIEPNSGDFTINVVEDISPTREPRVHNALPTHPTL